ncbi:MAG: hypothetical protein H0W03_09695 [Solirubrobacterales bacterium]|nr:hypothetical protein [Solirubrobacterales bacterium]
MPVVELRLPKGEVEVRGRMHARATVGDAGRVHGFVVDPADDHVTHLILQAGHLLGGQEVAVTCRWWDASGAEATELRASKVEIASLPDIDAPWPATRPGLG